jgi:peptidoglycan/xylan/chitin deacetylase (PgdA/CDA1 family)
MTQPKPHVVNALSFDVEDWFQCNGLGIDSMSQWSRYESRVAHNTERLLDLLRPAGVKATWFVLGYVGERTSASIRQLHAEGHEVASNGYAHQLI